MSDTPGLAQSGGGEKANILIVDDRPPNLLVLESALRDLGQNIVTARSGEEALKRLLEREFAVILLDVNMPRMDGFETAAYIRGSSRTAHTPIIFLTAYAEEMHAAKGYALGAVDCIVTPVIPEILRTKVQVFVQLYLMTREAKLAQVHRTTQEMEHAVTRVLAEASTLGEAIPRVVETICVSLGWHYGARWQWDENDGLLHRRESWGIDAPEIREFDEALAERPVEPSPPGGGLMRRAFASGKAVWISDLAKDASFKRTALATRAGLHGAFAFALLRGHEVLGVMEFFHRDIRDPEPMLVKIAESLGSEIGQYMVRMQAEEAVKFIAMHDALAVLFVDLDRFKLINDTLGHEAGDQVLREAAERLTDNLRAGDTVARLGGDEFVVLLEEIAERLYVGSVSQKLIAALAAPFTIKARDYHITASIGISMYPDDAEDPAALLKNADSAMYRAKEQGRNAFEFYSAHLGISSMERLRLEAGLRRALEHDELTLHYQPQIEACSGRIVGMEALVRWQHPDLGLLPPARFIRLAEETGLIVPLGEWVVRAACMAHREWQALRLAPSRIAVNLSPRQFLHAGLLKDMLRVLSETGCKGSYLELEITESMVMHDPAGAVTLIEQLKEMGVRIAVDDFGTGYSSLAYLKRFPIDSLKIDRSFIADVPGDSGNVAITQAIIAMARTLQLTVIAEGVETREQFVFLRGRGCDEVQGYYFSPPLPLREATILLQEGAAFTISTANGPIASAL